MLTIKVLVSVLHVLILSNKIQYTKLGLFLIILILGIVISKINKKKQKTEKHTKIKYCYRIKENLKNFKKKP